MRTHPKLDHSDCCAYAAPPNPNSAVVLQKGTLKENKLAGNLAYSITFNPQSARELKWSLLNWKGGGVNRNGLSGSKVRALYLWFTAGWQQCYRLLHILHSPYCYRNASGLDILLPNFNHFPVALRAALLCSATKVMA